LQIFERKIVVSHGQRWKVLKWKYDTWEVYRDSKPYYKKDFKLSDWKIRRVPNICPHSRVMPYKGLHQWKKVC
jgi:hypothetical protein